MSKHITEVLIKNEGEWSAITYKRVEPRYKDGWGDTIRELRESLGMSLDDLGRKIGVYKGTISRWEHEIAIPDVLMGIKLAKALKVTVETIFDI